MGTNRDGATEKIAAEIASQRERARGLWRRERIRVRGIETELLEKLQALAVEIASIEQSADHRDAELLERAEALCEQSLIIEDDLARLHRAQAAAAQQPTAATPSSMADSLTAEEINKLRSEVDRLQRELQLGQSEAGGLREELERQRQVNRELQQQWEDAEEQARMRGEALRLLHDQISLRSANDVDDTSLEQELADLKTERRSLVEKLDRVERHARETSRDDGDVRELAEMQRRLELAVAELRELKQQNAELSKNASRGALSVDANDSFDWETQKSRMIAALEAEANGNEPGANRQRLSIEGTIRITDQLIAEKDQEIARLTALVEQLQRARPAETATTFHSTSEEMQDELDRVKRLQDEWRDKIRQAEIDISLERAKLARDRAGLEQQLFEARAQLDSRPNDSGPSGKAGRNTKAGWFSRLGLGQDE